METDTMRSRIICKAYLQSKAPEYFSNEPNQSHLGLPVLAKLPALDEMMQAR